MRRRAVFTLSALPLLGTRPLAAQEVEVSQTRAAELVVVDLINLFRLENGLHPVELDTILTDLARERSQDMADRGYFGHYTPEGFHGPHLLQSKIAGGPYTSENLGRTADDYDVAMWALFDAWKESPSHLAIMLRPEFNWLGVGVVERATPFPGITLKFVTQVFVEQRGPIRLV